MNTYKAPAYLETAFNCTQCNAYAKQSWSDLMVELEDEENYIPVEGYLVAICSHCSNISLWRYQKLVYPFISEKSLPVPNQDLNQDIQDDFIEASLILHISPRGSAAILRLCLQKLCVQIGEKGKNINDDIASLVKKGLDPKIQKALDVVRVIGNNAVHPGEINIKDNPQTAYSLLTLINIIAEVLISQPKHVQDMYNSLPELALNAIEKRDKL